MLLWRINSNSLPTTENILKKIGIGDLSYALYGFDYCAHLFFKCPVAKVIWFASKWCMRFYLCPINSDEDIIKLVLDPSTHLLGAHHHREEEAV